MKLLDAELLVATHGTDPPEDQHVVAERYLTGLLTVMRDLEPTAEERPPAANSNREEA